MLVFRQALFEGVKISFEPLTSYSSTNNQHSEFAMSDARSISIVLQKVIKKLEDVKQLRKTWEREEHKRVRYWKYKRVCSKIYII